MLSGSQSSHLKGGQERKLAHVEKGPGEIKVIKRCSYKSGKGLGRMSKVSKPCINHSSEATGDPHPS